MIGISLGDSMNSIARDLGRSPSTLTCEVERNGRRENYVAWRAHMRARSETRRPKRTRLCGGPLLKVVAQGLEDCWSPQEISHRLRLDYPDDPEMRVCHETIYQSLYVQGRGELRCELARCLRTGRVKRKKQGGVPGSGKIPNRVMISERPAEIEDRAVPGHWEGDLIIGERGRSAVGTLVERSTRLVLLLHLPKDHGAEAVAAAMSKAIKTLPEELALSVTWDQGMEMANQASFTVSTGIPMYFCDPHSPLQRGANENTNGFLRQYLPKGTDLSQQSAADLLRIQRSLMGGPAGHLAT